MKVLVIRYGGIIPFMLKCYKTMNDQYQQAISYAQQQLSQGVQVENIRNNLIQNNWDETAVNQIISIASSQVTQTDRASLTNSRNTTNPHRIRNGVLWIISPFILLITAIIVEIIFRALGLKSAIVNILSVIIGMTGSVLLIVGPIVGIIKLSRK